MSLWAVWPSRILVRKVTKDPLHAITDCMMAADPAVSKESSAALDCIFSSSGNPLTECQSQIDACLAK